MLYNTIIKWKGVMWVRWWKEILQMYTLKTTKYPTVIGNSHKVKAVIYC